MGIRTKGEYLESVRGRKPVVYMDGDRIENIADHPAFQVGLNSAAVTFEQANDPRFSDLAKVWSPLVEEEVSRWTFLMQNEQDALAKAELNKALGDLLCPCHYRCLTGDLLHAAWAVSYDIDKTHGTNYHRNVQQIVRQAQKNDWIIGGGLVSPKGDRSKGAAEQADPDMYLHVVEKRPDGIVVRGAKAHGTAAPYTDMLCVVEMEFVPEYYVGFFTPIDAEGITYICRAPHAPAEPKDLDNPLSSRFGGHVEAMIVFEDVFVPWENVFMCGEVESIITFGPILLASHLFHKCLCRWVNIDLSIGAAALIADYNSVAGSPHILDELSEMAMDAEIVNACSIAAAVEGTKHESGIYYPKLSPVATGKVYSARKLGENRYAMQDIAGGLVATMASEKDFENPVTGKYLEKYYQGREGVPAEDRVRAFKLIEDLTASEFAGWYHVMCITGGSPSKTLKDMVAMECDYERCKAKARRAAKIEE
ncbi:MAG: 4-hydroxyphenylacetate 3-hydroxylase N-terminal domain-containing protein [Dehalococcoidia bacterium]